MDGQWALGNNAFICRSDKNYHWDYVFRFIEKKDSTWMTLNYKATNVSIWIKQDSLAWARRSWRRVRKETGRQSILSSNIVQWSQNSRILVYWQRVINSVTLLLTKKTRLIPGYSPRPTAADQKRRKLSSGIFLVSPRWSLREQAWHLMQIKYEKLY